MMIPNRIPLPTTIEVYNIVQHDSAIVKIKQQQGGDVTWTSPYATQLLPRRIRLEIRIEEAQPSASREEETEAGSKRSQRILLSETDPRECGVAASFPSLSVPRSSLTAAAYDSMQAFVYATSDPSSDIIPEQGGGGEVLLHSFPLHPSRLCRIAHVPQPDHFSLPLHCVFVTFSDHSIRMLPAHYQALLLQEPESAASSCLRVPEGDDPRFQEQAFSALDGLNHITTTMKNESDHGDDQEETLVTSPEDAATSQQHAVVDEDEDLLLLQHEYEEELRLSQWYHECMETEKADLAATQARLAEAQQEYGRLVHATPVPQVPPIPDDDFQSLHQQIHLSQMRLMRGVQALYPITNATSTNGGAQQQPITIRGCLLDQPGSAAMVQHCAVLVCRYLGQDVVGFTPGTNNNNLRGKVADVLRDRGVQPNNNGTIVHLLQSVYDHILSPTSVP